MAKNPVDEFLAAKTAARKDARQQELQQLNTWKTQGQRPEHLEPLMQAYAPVVAQKVRQWKAPAVNESAFRAELQKQLIGAFETYDPSRGAALNTHVENRLQKAKRFNLQNQNMGYIPEGQAMHIGRIQRAQDELTQSLGREPTHDELGNHLGMPVRQVKTITKSMRFDVPASTFETDPAEKDLSRDAEVLSLLPYSLTADEKAVFNHIYGLEGAKKTQSTNDLAKLLGKSPSQVSRLRSGILNKYKQYK